MTSSLSHRFLCIHSPELQLQVQPNHHAPPFKSNSPTLTPKPHCFARLRIATKASPPNNSATTENVENTPKKPGPPKPPLDPPSDDSFSSLLRRFGSGWLKFDELGMDILSVALPAAVALAADPLASLIDTAFVGHIGSVELAAVGVSTSVFNLVSKVFNVPLLNITTSFVAEEQALIRKEEDSSRSDESSKWQSKKLLPSVSTSLALAATLGIAETVALSLGSGIIMNIMGFSHAWTCRAFSHAEGLWCSSDSDCISCTRHFPWIYGHKDTTICCWCWQLS